MWYVVIRERRLSLMRFRLPRNTIWVALLAIVSGCAFATVIMVAAVISSGEAIDPLLLGYLVAGNVVLFSVVMALSILYANSRRSIHQVATRIEERMSRVLSHLNDVLEARTGLSEYLLEHQGDQERLDACVAQSSDFLKYLVDETRIMFEEYTDHSCAVSIKLLVASKTDVPDVKTYLRDTKSYFLRKALYEGDDGRYPYSDHSPFVDIVSGSANRNYYICNDLRQAWRAGIYKNGNQHWTKLYNATLIVPIRTPGITVSENIIGFLCIDSLTAKFDTAIGLLIGRLVANTIFYVIHSLFVFESRIAQKRAG